MKQISILALMITSLMLSTTIADAAKRDRDGLKISSEKNHKAKAKKRSGKVKRSAAKNGAPKKAAAKKAAAKKAAAKKAAAKKAAAKKASAKKAAAKKAAKKRIAKKKRAGSKKKVVASRSKKRSVASRNFPKNVVHTKKRKKSKSRKFKKFFKHTLRALVENDNFSNYDFDRRGGYRDHYVGDRKRRSYNFDRALPTCLPKHAMRQRLVRSGWVDFELIKRNPNRIRLRATNFNGRRFVLVLDSCSGHVIKRRPVRRYWGGGY